MNMITLFLFVHAVLPGQGSGLLNNAWLVGFPEEVAGLFSER